MLPNIGSFFVSNRDDKQYVIIKNHQGILALSNICRHHQAIILEGSGEINKIHCPFHRWQYNLEGDLISTPHFKHKPCVGLEKITTHQWQNLIFKNQAPSIYLSNDSLLHQLSFKTYTYTNSVELSAPYNWKIFIENYLDDLHIPAIHPGLRCLINLNNLKLEFGEGYSIQKYPLNRPPPRLSASPVFNEWAKMVAFLCDFTGSPPPDSILWALIYPNTMIEVYPYMVTISTLNALTPQKTVNHVDFFYPKLILEQFPEYPAISQTFYLETGKEDDTICTRIHQGRNILFHKKLDDPGFIHPNLEKGIAYFHKYYQKHMGSGYSTIKPFFD